MSGADALAVLDRDHAVLADLVHSVSNKLADPLVASTGASVRRTRSNSDVVSSICQGDQGAKEKGRPVSRRLALPKISA
jgi:hypothetical protein